MNAAAAPDPFDPPTRILVDGTAYETSVLPPLGWLEQQKALGVQIKSLVHTLRPALAPGKVAVVTGGASGIGLAAARRFADLGMRVCRKDACEQVMARRDGESN
jgi:NADPH:quinone reductase-like Zn-dependent oxidoreductase